MTASSISIQWSLLPEETHVILQELESWLAQSSLHERTDPTVVVPRLDQWQQQLESIDSHIHILWSFNPELALCVGPVEPYFPCTPWLQERLQDISMYKMFDEALTVGDFPQHALVSVRQEGWRLYIREQPHIHELTEATEDEKQYGILGLFDEEDALSWREELSASHQWAQLYIDAHMPYQAALHQQLEHAQPTHLPEFFAWLEALLLGLSEIIPEHGTLCFAYDLSQQENIREIGYSLLWERLQTLLCASSSTSSTARVMQSILAYLFPLDIGREKYIQAFQSQLSSSEPYTLFTGLERTEFEARCIFLEEHLQTAVIKSIEALSTHADAQRLIHTIEQELYSTINS